MARGWLTLLLFSAANAFAGFSEKATSYEELLRSSTLTREQVYHNFVSDNRWMQMDPELGYVHRNFRYTHLGLDRSDSITTYQKNGARTQFMYGSIPARINTYGDSFTNGAQVNDGETWQEYLAAHLGEPIRNFGVGGYGVYHAYLRLLREENTDHGAKYLIFYVWGDDSIRSLMRDWYPLIKARGSPLIMAPRPNVEIDLKTGEFVERKNLLPSIQSLDHLTDPQWMVDNLKEDLGLQLALFKLGVIKDLDRERISRLAGILDFPFNWDKKGEELQAEAEALLDRYSSQATIFILKKVRAFADQRGKKLLVALFSPDRALPDMVEGRQRFDYEIVDWLNKEKMNYFDMNEVHFQDFQRYKISFSEYMKQYIIGHYSPKGNHLFAFSIKDKVIQMLDPKPVTYQEGGVNDVPLDRLSSCQK